MNDITFIFQIKIILASTTLAMSRFLSSVTITVAFRDYPTRGPFPYNITIDKVGIYVQDVYYILCFLKYFKIYSGLWPFFVFPR